MPKRKNFNRRALSCTSTRTHLEGRRSVELMNLSFKPVRASCAQGFQGPYGGSELVLMLYRIYIFCFQKCNRLPELMINGDAGIFPVYYSIKQNPLCLESCVSEEFSTSPRLSRTIFGTDANSVFLRAHLCTAVDLMRRKRGVRNSSREREGLYNGNV